MLQSYINFSGKKVKIVLGIRFKRKKFPLFLKRTGKQNKKSQVSGCRFAVQ